jgi:uncharacterized protein (DUF1800 family)
MPSLLPYSEILGKRKAKHLLRRACFNFSPEKINEFAALTPLEALGLLGASSVKKVPEPIDPRASTDEEMHWTSSIKHPTKFTAQGSKSAYICAWWWYNAYNDISLEHKLTMFLHTCFTISKDEGTSHSTYFFDYLQLLQFYAFGDIRELANKITRDNAMTIYLDNNTNTKKKPNENYAREFLELFTILKGPQIGEGNYTNFTEHDVVEAAKVFSGYKNKMDRSLRDPDTGIPRGYISEGLHDQKDKTFSSAFGGVTIKGGTDKKSIAQEHRDFVGMIFNQHATAISYVRKLYRFFVKSEWNSQVEVDIIEPLAHDLRNNGYQLLPVLKRLLASEHFYDEDDSDNTNNIIGGIVKHPLQLWTEIISAMRVSLVEPKVPENYEEFYYFFFRNFAHHTALPQAGYYMFAPDSVAGYPPDYQGPDYDRHWFVSPTIVARYKFIKCFINGRNMFVNRGKFKSVINSNKYINEVVSNPYDASTVVREITDYLYPESIDEDRINHFKTFLTDGTKDSYWTEAWSDYKAGDGSTSRLRLNEFLIAVTNAAEFQLG